MKRSSLHNILVLTLTAVGMVAQTASAQITIETVPVGNAGNAADQDYGSSPFGPLGAVSYAYLIGKYEVTLHQYTAFLNAVAATDTYGLYNAQMGSNPNIMGIARSGESGSYTYSVIGSGNRPVTYVSWYDAARFVNWLHNGQPTGAQAAGTTETGAYTLTGNTGFGIKRNAGWSYGLPSENEWYKAAYYDQFLNSGSGGYWFYPTRSNAQPNSRNGSASDPNSANYYYDDSITNGFNGGYAMNDSTTIPAGNALTDVGAFSLAGSFYGTFDQGGNVFEWNDLIFMGKRGRRGGSWRKDFPSTNDVFYLRVSGQSNISPGTESDNTGFRIVTMPPVLNLSKSGGTLTFSWIGNFKLQAQTNSLSTGIGTNWSDYPSGGSSPVNLDINPANPTVFFRLSSP